MASRSKTNRKKTKSHHKTVSVGSGLKQYESFKVPRKLGPRDVGKIKYKGTKYEAENYDFLAEKLHKHARTSSFNARKAQNPLPKKPSVKELGSPNSWNIPKYFDSEVKRMSSTSRFSFLDDEKPLVVRHKTAFSDLPLPKGTFAREESAPFDWNPIDYEIHDDPSNFLNEKLWYEASKVAVEEGFSHLLETLPPEKWRKIRNIPNPTGYRSKQRFLERLKEIVYEEQMEHHHDDQSHLTVPKQLTALNEQLSTDDEFEMSGLSDFAEDIEKEMDREMTDALDCILAESTPELQSVVTLNTNLPTTLDDDDSPPSLDTFGSNASNLSLMSSLSDNRSDRDEIETPISTLSVVNCSPNDHDHETAFTIPTTVTSTSVTSPQEMLSPQFASRVSSRRSLLEKARSNIKESRRIRDDPNANANGQGMSYRKDTKFFDSTPISTSTSTVDDHEIDESKELEESSIIDNGTESMNMVEDTEMKSDGDSRGKQNAESQIEPKSESKLDSKVQIQSVEVSPVTPSKPKNERKTTVTTKTTNTLNTSTSSTNLNGTGYTAPIPSNFICPISKTIMNDVVMAADGRMYDRTNIEKYLESHNTSPVKGTKMRNKNLMPFNELTDKITRWKMKHRVIKRKRKKRKTVKPKKNDCRSDGSSVSVQSAKSTGDEDAVRKGAQSAECGLDSSDTC